VTKAEHELSTGLMILTSDSNARYLEI